MIATPLEMKRKAVELLNELNVNPSLVHRFDNYNKIPYFDHVEHFMTMPQDIAGFAHELTRRYDYIVYACTREQFFFGECLTFLVVPKYKEDFDTLVKVRGCSAYCYAFVMNLDDDDLSEFGSCAFVCRNGLLRRVG